MKKKLLQGILIATFVMTLFTVFLGGVSVAFGAEMQKDELADMLEATPTDMLQDVPVCSNSFVISLNKNNTVMWVNDPRSPWKGVPCCINGVVCQPYPSYTHYVVAMPTLQSEYDCSKIAKNCGYTPICQLVVGEALDPTRVCAECVPYRMTFWATVYQNNNAPKPPSPSPPPSPPSDPCRGKICPGKTRCVNGHCVQIR